MILTLDIGNTNIHFGLFEGGDLLSQWRISTDPQATSDELGLAIVRFLKAGGYPPGEVNGVAAACVVPPLDGIVEGGIDRYLGREVFFVDPVGNSGMDILYDRPSEVGADRVANAVAGVELAGAPLVIVDFGTATTFDVVSPGGEYLGGVIAPGIELSIGALTHKAARLPRIDLGVPERVIGRTTTESIRSGIVHGYAGLVDRIVGNILDELGGPAEILATGGLAGLIVPGTERVERIEENLTLEGIRLIYDRNMV